MSSNLPEEEKLDPRVVRTRNLLGKAFIEALAEKGFQAVSVQDITERGRRQPHHLLPAFPR